MTNEKEKRNVRVVYTIFGIESDEKPNNAVVGLIWCLVIITLPIWIWGWLTYQIVWVFGSLLNGVKKREVEAEKEERYY